MPSQLESYPEFFVNWFLQAQLAEKQTWRSIWTPVLHSKANPLKLVEWKWRSHWSFSFNTGFSFDSCYLFIMPGGPHLALQNRPNLWLYQAYFFTGMEDYIIFPINCWRCFERRTSQLRTFSMWTQFRKSRMKVWFSRRTKEIQSVKTIMERRARIWWWGWESSVRLDSSGQVSRDPAGKFFRTLKI